MQDQIDRDFFLQVNYTVKFPLHATGLQLSCITTHKQRCEFFIAGTYRSSAEVHELGVDTLCKKIEDSLRCRKEKLNFAELSACFPFFVIKHIKDDFFLSCSGQYIGLLMFGHVQ